MTIAGLQQVPRPRLASPRVAIACLLLASGLQAGPRRQSPEEQTWLDWYAEADRLWIGGDLVRAVEHLESGLGELPLSWQYESFFRLRVAQFLTDVPDWQKAEEHLEWFEVNSHDNAYYRSLACTAAGMRGQLNLLWGLTDRADKWIAAEARGIEALAQEGVEVSSERLELHMHQANLELARNEVDVLEKLVDGLLLTPLYDVDDESVRDDRARLLLKLGKGLNERERFDVSAPRRARTVLEEAAALADRANIVEIQLILIDLDLRGGDHDAARERLAVVRAMLEQQGSGGASFGFARWAVYNARLELAAGGRAGVRAARVQLEQALQAFLDRWRDVELRSGGYGILQYGQTQALISEWMRTADALDGNEAAARAGLRAISQVRMLGSLCRRMSGTEIDAVTVVEDLIAQDSERGFLVYLPSEERTHLIVASEAGMAHYELPSDDRIDAIRKRVQAFFEEPERSVTLVEDQARALERLRDALLPRVVQDALPSWRAVTVLGLDLFRELPFEALPMGDGWIGTQLAVDVLPSLAVAEVLDGRTRREFDRDELWLVADPQPAPGFDAGVTIGDRRIADLAATFRASSSRTLTGSEATVDRLSAAEMGRAAVLEIVSHGVSDASAERSQGIVLTPSTSHPDGVLRAADVEQLRDLPALVVLVSCRSGSSPLRRGDACAASLAGAFLLAGAQAVVTSDLDLDVAAAHRLSRELLAQVALGAAPAEALRHARHELAQDPRFADPFYFATLRITGAAQRPLLNAQDAVVGSGQIP